MIRDYRFLEREGALQLRTDRQRFLPWGLDGGKPGAPSSNILVSDEQTRQLASKEYLTLHRGDLLRHTLAGAGGTVTRSSVTRRGSRRMSPTARSPSREPGWSMALSSRQYPESWNQTHRRLKPCARK